MKKNEVRTIPIDLYKCHLTFFAGSMGFIEQWCRENLADDEDECECVIDNFKNSIIERQAGGAFVFYEREYFVWVKRPNSMPEIAHELYHAANYILTNCGVKHDEIDEPFAYLLEYLMRAVSSKKR